MTRPHQDWPPHVLALMLVALVLVILLGWRALTLESVHRPEPAAVATPETAP